jgi:hypothetical protein
MSKPIWTGRILSALTGIFMRTSGIVKSRDVLEGFAKFGYNDNAILLL